MELPGLRVIPAEILCGVGGVVGIGIDPDARVASYPINAIDGRVCDERHIIGSVVFAAGGDEEAVGDAGVEGGEYGAIDAVAGISQRVIAVVGTLDGDG